VAAVDQPSVRWHASQILDHIRPALTGDRRARATALTWRTLTTSRDGIARNTVADVPARRARDDPGPAARLRPELRRLPGDRRRSVATRAARRPAGPGGRRGGGAGCRGPAGGTAGPASPEVEVRDMRVVFAAYLLLSFGGLAYFLIVGLTGS
jgi:hypothetical protein